MKKLFDTAVQKLKYKVLREVARLAFEDQLDSGALLDIPAKIMPGPKPTMRCCIYKERAIIGERIKLAMGGNKKNPNVVEVLDIACDECPVEGMRVSEACRGCISHQCVDVCPKGAISIVNHRSVIDQSKCVECGKCLNACPYNAIIQCVRPCESACHINAIHMGEDKKAKIDNEKCISCGACVYKCPFGAIADKSYILEAIKLLKESENNSKYNVYAVVAPSIVSQFVQVRVEQVVSGLKHLGFFSVVEAALGADMVAYQEANELYEKGFLTSSCCPAFVTYVRKAFPDLAQHVSHNLSPMAQIAKHIKRLDPGCKIVFVGPCIAKKMEQKWETVSPYIDCVITFEKPCLMRAISTSPPCLTSTSTTPLTTAASSPAAAALPARSSKRFGSRACMTWAISAISPFPATASANAAPPCSRRPRAFCRKTSSRVWRANRAASAARPA